jgi:hypothetical protein
VLVVGGWIFETSGIGLIAAAELIPRMRKLGAWLLARIRRAENALRSLLRLPRRHHVVVASAAVTAGASMSAIGVVGVDANASPDRKIEFLIRQAEELQRRIMHRSPLAARHEWRRLRAREGPVTAPL